jgi:excisionase family DNA binding protein
VTHIWERVKAVLSRINGVSTPYGGVSWDSLSRSANHNTASRSTLKPEECAHTLGIRTKDVLALLEHGELEGLKTGQVWRITSEELSRFLSTRQERARLEALWRYLRNPRAWARELRKDPAQVQLILGGQFEEGTHGKFLQDALRQYPDDDSDGP